MKLRKILCGVTAAAIALGSLTVYAQTADEGDVTAQTVGEDGATAQTTDEDGATAQTVGEDDVTAQADDEAFTGEYVQDGIKYYVYADEVTVRGAVETSITNAEIPETIKGRPVTMIGSNAFADCTALQTVTFPDGLKAIGSGAFMNCKSLTKADFNDKLEIIDNMAFYGCEGLLALLLPKSTKRLGSYAFYGCKGIYAQFGLNNGLESIGDHAFAECDSLTQAAIPYTVKYSSSGMFYGCDKLAGIGVSTAPSGYKDVTYEVRDNVLYYHEEYFPGEVSLAVYPISTYNKTLELGDDVKYIEDFDNVIQAKYLTEFKVNGYNPRYYAKDGVLISRAENTEAGSLYIYPPQKEQDAYTIPAEVAAISSGAFCGTTKLKKVIIPKSVYTVEYDAFNYTRYGDRVTVKSSVTDIEFEGTMEEWEFISYYYSHGSKGGDDSRPFVYGDIVVTCSNGTVDKNGMHPFDSSYERTTFFACDPVLLFKARCEVDKGAFESAPRFSAGYIFEDGRPDFSLPYTRIGVRFYDSDGNSVEPKGGYKLYINGGSKYVYSVEKDGKLTKLTSRVGEKYYPISGSYTEVYVPHHTGEIYLTDTEQPPEEPPVSSSTSSSEPEQPPVSSSTSSSIPEQPPVSSSSSWSIPEQPPVSSSSSSSVPEQPPVSSSSSSSEPEQPPVSSSSGEPDENVPEPDKVTDKDTGVTVEADKGTFEQETVLVVTPMNTVITDGENSLAFDIKFLANGSEVQPGKPVTVRIPIPAALEGKTLYVYHVDANGSYTDMNAKIEDGMVVFTTDHFSKYILTALKHSPSGTVSKPDGNAGGDSRNPSTGAAVAFVPVLIAAGAFTALFTRKTK